jgi:hypothetical protein
MCYAWPTNAIVVVELSLTFFEILQILGSRALLRQQAFQHNAIWTRTPQWTFQIKRHKNNAIVDSIGEGLRNVASNQRHGGPEVCVCRYWPEVLTTIHSRFPPRSARSSFTMFIQNKSNCHTSSIALVTALYTHVHPFALHQLTRLPCRPDPKSRD